jgi:hypothetical protein
MTSTAKEARAAITMAEDATFDDAAAEKARVDAEARRQRILEKSRERMGVVSGEKPAGEPDDQEAPFGESRMQAMRRRRFKKSAPAKEEGDKKGDTSDVKPVEPAETSAEAAASSDAPAEESEVAKPATTTETETSKKKYKGVAKMRREALKKDKKEPEVDSSTSAVVTVPLICKPPVYRLPIVLHLFAVLLLFLAGLDIGWNQVVLSDVMIHRQLAPMEHGAGLLNRIKAFSSKSVVEDPSKLLDTGMDGWPETTQEEFVSPGEEEEEYIPNIDPLFQIDLDLVTKGDGILNVLARGAVNIHRLILRVFYYLPLSMLRTMIAIPQQLVATPPVLCIVSLVVRQAAKLVFGANLPDPARSKKDTKDVFGMIRQSVATFLSSSFPTAVSLYDIWTHLRSDMYVILCGVFVGLAYTHHIGSDESYGISDEL